MSIAPHFEMVTELMPTIRRDFAMADATLLNPNNANPLYDGEWLELNGSYQAARGNGAAIVPSYPVFAERGRYDTQAIGKVPLIFLGGYEFDTTVIDPANVVVGSQLMVDDVTIDAVTKKGLKLATQGKLIVAWATRLLSATKIRCVHPYGYCFKP